jgi:hypothetical protein
MFHLMPSTGASSTGWTAVIWFLGTARPRTLAVNAPHRRSAGVKMVA